MAFMVYEHTPGAERETTIDFDAQTARVDIAPGQWATVPFLEKAAVQADGSFAFKIEQGGLIRNYVGKVEENGVPSRRSTADARWRTSSRWSRRPWRSRHAPSR